MIARSVLRADPCAYCQDTGGTIDHIEPLYRGGRDVTLNRTGACPRCNNLKDHTPMLLFLVRRRYPVRPMPFDRYRVSPRRQKKIRRAFERLATIERNIRATQP